MRPSAGANLFKARILSTAFVAELTSANTCHVQAAKSLSNVLFTVEALLNLSCFDQSWDIRFYRVFFANVAKVINNLTFYTVAHVA